MAEEWFRSPAWDTAARADFEARLARARAHKRQQYLWIKAVSLRTAGNPDGARELLERVVDYDRPDGHLGEIAAAREMLGNLAVERGDRASAEHHYRSVLALPSPSGSSGSVEISLADLLLDTGRAADRPEAAQLLDAWLKRDQLRLDHDLFRWHLVLIRLAKATGDRETVRRAANTAITLAERGPRLPRHPDVGLVRADQATLKRLRRLAR